jgi:HAT1-interacting factor 1
VIRRGLHGELAPQLAPLLLAYGKALFEVACKQTGVLGKAEDAPAEEPEDKGKSMSTVMN